MLKTVHDTQRSKHQSVASSGRVPNKMSSCNTATEQTNDEEHLLKVTFASDAKNPEWRWILVAGLAFSLHKQNPKRTEVTLCLSLFLWGEKIK